MLDLNQLGSDHSLLLLRFKPSLEEGPKSFVFLNFWLSHLDFRRVVHDTWDGDDMGHPMRVLLVKMRQVKQCLRQWSKEFFGSILIRCEWLKNLSGSKN